MMKKLKIAMLGIAGAIILCYLLATFTECPVLSDARTLWIETAMTTGDHQWLAKIFPQSVIDKVMSKQVNEVEGVAGISSDAADGIPTFGPLNELYILKTEPNIYSLSAKFFDSLESKRTEQERIEAIKEYWEGDPLGQEDAAKSGLDKTGRQVIVNDIEQGIMISLVQTATYTGRVVQIEDPSRVFVGTTDQKGVQGKLICDYLADENAILGINASGFSDFNGNGLGGEIIGATLSKGELWGDLMYSSMTIGFTEDDKLIAGTINNWDEYALRDAIQFGPVLIKDGQILTEGSSGWGLQPRTVIAQRNDGAVLFMVVDGRKPGYSIGATMGDCASVLLEYGAITAAACDGGSSSVLAYNGEIINDPSTPMETGRYLPNAFLVKRR